ncbi:putative transmembrane domain protein, partial [Chlamydia psittaci 06-1683]
MTQSFDVLSQNAFKKIFNKQRFLFIFSSLCCFGFVFSI